MKTFRLFLTIVALTIIMQLSAQPSAPVKAAALAVVAPRVNPAR